MRVSFNWLKDYVEIRISPQALAEKLTMVGLEVTSCAHIDEDTIFDIEVTPNRPDCLSIIGIAREAAALTARPLKIPPIHSLRGLFKLSLPIQIQEQRLCRRYLGRVIQNVQLRPSPPWLIQRLEVMGVRPMCNIVDITNFCLLECGQPLHAFDLDKLQGQKIIVRSAKEGEQIITIDGVSRQLGPDMLVIADKSSPQAIAGIMGSRDSEVTEATRNILLESAYFDPLNIHNTSRKLGLATESSYRFERGVDIQGVYWASVRAAELIKKLAYPVKKQVSVAGRAEKRKPRLLIGRTIDKGHKALPPTRVHFSLAEVKQSLGVEISPAQIKAIIQRFQLKIVRRSPKALVVEIPSFRQDLSRQVDLIEEIARLYGYGNIPLNVAHLAPNLSSVGKLELATEEVYHNIRQILVSLGFNEIMTYSLIGRESARKLELPYDDKIVVKNPLSYEQEILRPTLLVGMLNTILANLNRKNLTLRLFELSRIYRRTQPGSTQECTNLCLGIAGKRSDNWLRKASPFTFFDLKGAIETLLGKLGITQFLFQEGASPIFVPGRCAGVFIGIDQLGLLGEFKKDILKKFDLAGPVYLAELELAKLLGHISQGKKFTPLERFPSIERDISLIAAQEVSSEQISALIQKNGKDLVIKVTLFDQYFGEQIPQGFRGLAYSIEYRSNDRTLKTEEIDKLHSQIRQALSEELKVQLR